MILVRTVSGRRIDLSRPRAEDFVLGDIATGLSHCCRFAGQVREFYSVAQHAYLVAWLLPPTLKLHGLHHDDSEAYMGDLSRYLKHHELLAGYRVIEAGVQAAIERRFHLRMLTDAEREQIKVADDVAALFEQIVVREQREFTLAAIYELIEQGFVRRPITALGSTVGEMMKIAESDFPCWPSRTARQLFIQVHAEYVLAKECLV